MKKLIFGLALTVVGMAQAASVSWSMPNVYGPDGATKPGKETYTAYLFVTANSTDVSTGINVVTKSDVMAILTSGNLSGLDSYASVIKGNTGTGTWMGATGLGGESSKLFSSGSLSAFAVIIDSTSLESAEHYFLISGGEERSVTFGSASGAQTLLFGSQDSLTFGDAAASNWIPVPEPTSGLLLLLGMGALALRRKQA